MCFNQLKSAIRLKSDIQKLTTIDETAFRQCHNARWNHNRDQSVAVPECHPSNSPNLGIVLERHYPQIGLEIEAAIAQLFNIVPNEQFSDTANMANN
jgi:hypothetical protein